MSWFKEGRLPPSSKLNFRFLISSMFIPLRSNIKAVGVSAATGEGVERLFECFDESAVEFQEEYLPELLK